MDSPILRRVMQGDAKPASEAHSVQRKRQYSGSRFPRLRWTKELHDRFLISLRLLGGHEKATPKSILQLMSVKGLTIGHVKSHLQMYRSMKNEESENPDFGTGSASAFRKRAASRFRMSYGSKAFEDCFEAVRSSDVDSCIPSRVTTEAEPARDMSMPMDRPTDTGILAGVLRLKTLTASPLSSVCLPDKRTNLQSQDTFTLKPFESRMMSVLQTTSSYEMATSETYDSHIGENTSSSQCIWEHNTENRRSMSEYSTCDSDEQRLPLNLFSTPFVYDACSRRRMHTSKTASSSGWDSGTSNQPHVHFPEMEANRSYALKPSMIIKNQKKQYERESYDGEVSLRLSLCTPISASSAEHTERLADQITTGNASAHLSAIAHPSSDSCLTVANEQSCASSESINSAEALTQIISNKLNFESENSQNFVGSNDELKSAQCLEGRFAPSLDLSIALSTASSWKQT
ncbi:hypothetical protein KP509_07G030100 [Ceratopteris richardii]|uniref:HTH myb-type domain-containing protein n=1 Tax=Ceratopteris richardii TaxID=49495 RepID=A0A8T2U9Q8_CERRI|nr:hypothetical protein KP509_07G030100 [Ceratopteris richardii]